MTGLTIIHCTYCWRTHHAPSLQWWTQHNQIGCGKDPARGIADHASYIAYARQYKAGWDEANSQPTTDVRPMAMPVQLSLFAEATL